MGRAASGLAVQLAFWLSVAAAVVPTPSAPRDDTVLVGELSFLDRLVNPCQVARTGPLVPASAAADDDDQRQSTEELVVEVQLASSLVRDVRVMAGVPNCDGLHLRSQPLMSDLSGLPRRQALTELYRMCVSEVAHLYLMAQEIVDSHHTCGNESFYMVDKLVTLAGSLQNILCVISESVPPATLRPVVDSVKGVALHRYRDCSRRLMRNCLVLDNTIRMLALSTQYLHEAELTRAAFLHQRMARSVRRRVDRVPSRRSRY